MYGVRGQKYVLFALQPSIHENSPVFKDFFTINFFLFNPKHLEFVSLKHSLCSVIIVMISFEDLLKKIS